MYFPANTASDFRTRRATVVAPIQARATRCRYFVESEFHTRGRGRRKPGAWSRGTDMALKFSRRQNGKADF
jgi:hypothetical protein